MACLTSAIEPLRAANEIAGEDLFQWQLLSETGEAVQSSANVVFQPDHALNSETPPDYLFILSGPKGTPADTRATYGKLRNLARHGTPLGAFSGGVFHLARAGLLEGHKCSVHWCYETAFKTEFPGLNTTDDVIVLGPSRFTASGAAAAFDMMLSFIGDVIGAEIATEVACWFQHPVVRAEGVRQRMPSLRTKETTDSLPPLAARAIKLFSQNLEHPVATHEAAQELGVSPRHLERVFKEALGQSPGRYYRVLRLRAARQLVLYSNQTITAIAYSIGYSNASAFVRNYKQEFGVRPAEDRLNANSFRVEDNLPLPSV